MRQKKLFIGLMLLITICLPKLTYATGNPVNVYGNSLTPDAGIGSIGGAVIGIIQVVAVLCGIIATIVLGIKYMYSAPGEKAIIKNKLMPLIIGCVLVFGAASLVDLVYTLASTL